MINSYTENAGVAGQNNQQVASYADLGEVPSEKCLGGVDPPDILPMIFDYVF